jgi:hypothetical protein
MRTVFWPHWKDLVTLLKRLMGFLLCAALQNRERRGVQTVCTKPGNSTQNTMPFQRCCMRAMGHATPLE